MGVGAGRQNFRFIKKIVPGKVRVDIKIRTFDFLKPLGPKRRKFRFILFYEIPSSQAQEFVISPKN
jgi:hypothetical protein